MNHVYTTVIEVKHLLSAASKRPNEWMGHDNPLFRMLRDPNVGVGGRRLLLCTLRTAARRDGPSAYFDFSRGEDSRAGLFTPHVVNPSLNSSSVLFFFHRLFCFFIKSRVYLRV